MRTMQQPRTRQPRATDDQWAERLARRLLLASPTPSAPATQPLLEAIAALWELFDQARLQVNAAMARVGVLERITLWRGSQERRYELTIHGGSARTISVFIQVPVVHDQLLGGVEISTSQTRQPISLIPVLQDDRVRWQVASLGTWFDEDLVRNLFLSVFADDPIATARLSPLSGSDAFETPWS
ncbi:MAG TPA: hypothetical protein VNL35_08905 [Chloroflexota bacterium]|nr:hypothetical protein [Chloroflexota bacterium]